MIQSRLLEWLGELENAVPGPKTRPVITLSFAQSLDGALTRLRGKPTSLSGKESTAATHLIRSRHQGILVGIGTVLADDPRLTVRPPVGKDPRPIVIDSRLRLPIESRLLHGDRGTLVVHGPSYPSQKKEELIHLGAVPVEVPTAADGLLDLVASLKAIKDAGVSTLMVEGGGVILTSFLSSGIWDRVALTIVPRWIGGYGLPFGETLDETLVDVRWMPFGDDVLCLGRRNS